ncbi:GNAT family N-acetyltransferase [Spirosoma koreense]
MADIKLELNEKKHGAFNLYEANEKIGEMVVSISGSNLTVFHTEVIPAAEGKGYAKQLLDEMVAYVRANHLNVTPLCPYVLAQFRRHPDQYTDIWNQEA